MLRRYFKCLRSSIINDFQLFENNGILSTEESPPSTQQMALLALQQGAMFPGGLSFLKCNTLNKTIHNMQFEANFRRSIE